MDRGSEVASSAARAPASKPAVVAAVLRSQQIIALGPTARQPRDVRGSRDDPAYVPPQPALLKDLVALTRVFRSVATSSIDGDRPAASDSGMIPV